MTRASIFPLDKKRTMGRIRNYGRHDRCVPSTAHSIPITAGCACDPVSHHELTNVSGSTLPTRPQEVRSPEDMRWSIQRILGRSLADDSMRAVLQLRFVGVLALYDATEPVGAVANRSVKRPCPSTWRMNHTPARIPSPHHLP